MDGIAEYETGMQHAMAIYYGLLDHFFFGDSTMPSLRRIVAATDFSVFSERVIQRAAQLAKQHQAELHLMHVVRPLDLYPGLSAGPDAFGQGDEDLRQNEQNRLETMAAGLADDFGIEVLPISRLGRAHAEIASYAREISADLLAAGARGESTLMDLVLGSTVSRILRVAPCPVLIVRNAAADPYGHVVAAVDFSPASAVVLEYAVLLAGGARVQALHVLGSEVEQRLRRAKADRVDVTGWLARLEGDAEAKLAALLAAAPDEAAIERVVRPGFAPAVICECIETNQADLIVVGRHGHGGGLQDWLLGSVSKDVALAASCDVLVIAPSAV